MYIRIPLCVYIYIYIPTSGQSFFTIERWSRPWNNRRALNWTKRPKRWQKQRDNHKAVKEPNLLKCNLTLRHFLSKSEISPNYSLLKGSRSRKLKFGGSNFYQILAQNSIRVRLDLLHLRVRFNPFPYM
jgi:hypothetical protein